MIKLIDTAKYGLMLWGTKLGAQIFAQNNISTTETRPFTDLREIGVRFETAEALLFSYEHKDGYHAYTIYRSLLDWRNRSGYFAISIFVADNKSAPLDKLPALLQELADIYSKEYYDKAKNQISEQTRENIAFFTAPLNAAEYRLSDIKDTAKQEKQLSGYKVFNNKSELANLFSFLHPVEEPDLDVLWLLENEALVLPPETNLKQLSLPSYPKDLKLKVSVFFGASPLSQVKFRVKTGRTVNEYESDAQGCFFVEELSERDKLNFELLSSEYDWREMPPQGGYTMQACKKAAAYELKIELKKKAELHTVSIFCFNLKDETNAKITISRKNGHSKSYSLEKGKCEVAGVEIGEELTISFSGNDEFKPFNKNVQVLYDKGIKIELEKNIVQEIKKPENTIGNSNKIPEKNPEPEKKSKFQLLLAIGLAVTVLILLFILGGKIMEMFGGPSTPKENPFIALEAKVNEINKPAWEYDSLQLSQLQKERDSLCNALKDSVSICNDLNQLLADAAKQGKFRKEAGNILLQIDTTSGKDELDALLTEHLGKKEAFMDAYKDSTKFVEIREKINEKIEKAVAEEKDKKDPKVEPKVEPKDKRTPEEKRADFITACGKIKACLSDNKEKLKEKKREEFKKCTNCCGTPTPYKNLENDADTYKENKDAKKAWKELSSAFEKFRFKDEK
jgi:hypothetical protein